MACSSSSRRSYGATRVSFGCTSIGSSTRQKLSVALSYRGVMRPAWEPTERYLERSRLRRFAERNGHRDYASLLRWSTDDLEGFWRATERELAIQRRVPYSHTVDQSRGMPSTLWWTGRPLTYLATAVRH